jgi:hypothetical protein
VLKVFGAATRDEVGEWIAGSHQVFRHPDHPHRVVVPMHARDLARGTLLHIVEASGVTRDEFMDPL